MMMKNTPLLHQWIVDIKIQVCEMLKYLSGMIITYSYLVVITPTKSTLKDKHSKLHSIYIPIIIKALLGWCNDI